MVMQKYRCRLAKKRFIEQTAVCRDSTKRISIVTT